MAGSTFSLTRNLSDAQVARLVYQARQSLDLTPADLADRIGRGVADVSAWEEGTARPTDEDVTVIAALTGVSADALVRRVEAFAVDRAMGILRVGGSTAYVDPSQGNMHVLRTYIGLVRTMRMLADDEPVELRSQDLDVLADYLDLDDGELVDELARAALVSHAEARELHRQLLRRPLVASVAGLIAGGLAVAGVGGVLEEAAAEADPAAVESPASTTVADRSTATTLTVTTPSTTATVTTIAPPAVTTSTTSATTPRPDTAAPAPPETAAPPRPETAATSSVTTATQWRARTTTTPGAEEPDIGEAVVLTNPDAAVPLSPARP